MVCSALLCVMVCSALCHGLLCPVPWSALFCSVPWSALFCAMGYSALCHSLRPLTSSQSIVGSPTSSVASPFSHPIAGLAVVFCGLSPSPSLPPSPDWPSSYPDRPVVFCCHSPLPVHCRGPSRLRALWGGAVPTDGV